MQVGTLSFSSRSLENYSRVATYTGKETERRLTESTETATAYLAEQELAQACSKYCGNPSRAERTGKDGAAQENGMII